MANNSKKYISLSKLSTFLDNLKTTFSTISHKHTMSDITDYTIDSELSSTSTNPVQNKVIDAEFEAMVEGMNALELAIDGKSDSTHTHDDRYYTEVEVDAKVEVLNTAIDGKAASTHTHDDRYYTETEIDTKLSSKADSNHNHDSAYDTKGAAADSLVSAKSYTDTKTSGLASTTVVDTKISTHNTSNSAHNDIRALITDLTTKLNNFLDIDDATTDQLSEVIQLINDNKGTLESLTTSKVNVSDIIDNLTTSSATKVLSAKQGVAIKTLIDNLQVAVDGKAASSHNHAASEITSGTLSSDRLPTVPIAKGGTGATTAAAALTNLGITATASELNKLDGVTATTTELNYVDGVTSSIQTQLNEKVPTNRTVNGKALSSNISLSANDVGAYTKSEIDNMTFITLSDIDTICSATISMATLDNEVTF